MGSMPPAMRWLQDNAPHRFREACQKGGRNAAKKRAAVREAERDILEAIALEMRIRIEQDIWDHLASGNEHVLTPGGNDPYA